MIPVCRCNPLSKGGYDPVRDNTKVKKIVKRSTPKRRFLVETKYGAQFIISFDDVVWVKTGTRWPKHVYNLMKGIGNNNG